MGSENKNRAFLHFCLDLLSLRLIPPLSVLILLLTIFFSALTLTVSSFFSLRFSVFSPLLDVFLAQFICCKKLCERFENCTRYESCFAAVCEIHNFVWIHLLILIEGRSIRTDSSEERSYLTYL